MKQVPLKTAKQKTKFIEKGSLHPRGGQLFPRDRLDALDKLHSQLLDIAFSLE